MRFPLLHLLEILLSRSLFLQSSTDDCNSPSLLPPASSLLAANTLMRLFTSHTVPSVYPVLGFPASFLNSWPLKLGPICSPKTSVKNCHCLLRNNQEERSSQLLCGGSLKSGKVKFFQYIFSQVLLRVEEQRNILHEISKRKANWIGHILRRNCLLREIIEGKIKWRIEVTGRRGRRRRKLLDNLKERRGYSHLKEEALDLIKWSARVGRGFGPVVRQTAKWMTI
jgi:hypothetical protein